MLSCNYSMGEQNLHLKFTEIDNSFVVRHSHRENKSPAVFVSKEKKMGTEVRIITPLITMDCAPADIFFSFDKDTLTDLKTPLNGFRATLFSQGVIFDICFEENY